MKRRLAVSLLVLFGCGADPVLVQPASFERDLLFVLRATPDGRTTAIVQASPANTDEAGLRLALDAGADALIVLGVNAVALRAAHPGYADDRASEIVLSAKGATSRQLAPGHALVAVPTSSALFRYSSDVRRFEKLIEPDAARLRAGLELSVPVAADFCADVGQGALRPFGATASVLRDAGCEDTFLDIHRLDARRVVGLTPSSLVVLERGQPFDCEQRSASGRTSRIAVSRTIAMAVDPRIRPDGSRLIVFVHSRGSVSEVMLSPDGFGLVRTATTINATTTPGLSRPADFRFEDVEVDADGNVLTVGSEGFGLTRSADQQQWVGFQVDTAEAPNIPRALERVAVTGDPEYPFLAITDRALYRFDARADDWRTQSVRIDGINRIALRGVSAFGQGEAAEYGAIAVIRGVTYVLGSKRGETMVEVAPEFVAALAPCLDSSGQRLINGRRIALGATSTYVLAACSAVARLRRSDGCVSAITLEDRPEILSGVELFRELSLGHGFVTVGGAGGELYEADLR